MRCKRHLTDTSSGVGVCASCLRERLFILIAAQTRQLAQAQAQAQAQVEDRRKSDAHHPPPLVFPRSVSPYIYRHSNNDSSGQHHNFDQRFYRTPQVGPTSATTTTTINGGAVHKKKHRMLSRFASLFVSRSEKPESDGQDPRASRVSGSSLATSPYSSPISQTWLSALIPTRRKKQSRLFSFEDAAPNDGGHRLTRREDRGMSPVRDVIGHYGDYEDSSAYSSECSPHRLKQTPTRARRRGQHSRNVSGLAVCFSPLVRASPSRQHRNVDVRW